MSGLGTAMLQSIWYPREIASMLQLKFGYPSTRTKKTITESAAVDNDYDFAYLVLNQVSRSFAVVIRLLDPELRDAICLFYLILRGLDSVEDDMDYPIDKKIPLLRTFHQKLYEKGWNVKDCGDKPEYRELMASFEKIIAFFETLKPAYKEVICDITDKMGNGMADFAEKYDGLELNGVDTVQEYEHYCHYVAGLVGLGLDRLFIASGLESYDLSESQNLANSMGLFLQKINITRDYLEDLNDKRSWWPKEIWGKYSPDLAFFAQNPYSVRSRLALNNMVYNALKHTPDLMAFCSKLKTQSIFNFCAVPQVMAVASLAVLFNNNDALTRTIKVRKGITADVAINCTDISMFKAFFLRAFEEIKVKLIHPEIDPFYANATPEEMKLAIQLHDDIDTMLKKCITACDGAAVINNGWDKICGVLIAAGAITFGAVQLYTNNSNNLK